MRKFFILSSLFILSGVFVFSLVFAVDGSGTNTVSPTSVDAGSTGNTLTFTYTAAETMGSGELAITVPTGWSVPQGSVGTAGYTTAASVAGTIANVLDNADSISGWSAGTQCGNGLTLNTTTKHEGTASISCAAPNTAAGDVFYKNIASQDWSGYTKVAFWIHSDKGLAAGNLQFSYDDSSNLASPIENISVPAYVFNSGWNYVVLTFGATTRSSVVSFGFRNNSGSQPLDFMTLRIDDLLIGPGLPTFPGGGDIRARILQLSSGQTVTVTYGSGGGSSGATAPASSETSVFTTKTRIDDAGTLTAIASSPTVTVNADTTAPAAVNNLAVTGTADTTATLSWTAPGDDGSTGTATSYDLRYSTSVITDGNFSSATQASGEPTPSVAGTSESMTVTGLSDNTTYHFALKASDEVPNASAISNVPSGTTTATPDTTAPAAVSNLSASSVGQTSITLTWTAPGDDGSTGTATTYDLRYSTAAITSDNFSSATAATGEPAPSVAGTSESMTVSGLSPSTAYFFAIKTSDEVPNTSAISNLPSGTTSASESASTASIPTGGGASVAPTRVVFSGQAWPGATIEILRRSVIDLVYTNTPIETSVINADGSFRITSTALLQGEYFFALRAKDPEDRETGITSFTVNLISTNELLVEDLLLSPTIGVAEAVLTKGKDLMVSGYVVPNSRVEVFLNNNFFGETISGKDGRYAFSTSTANFSLGNYSLRTRYTDISGKKSDFSTLIAFKLSSLIYPKADFNGDNAITIVDWSIFLFRWAAVDGAFKSTIDLDGNGKVDIIDFSIFLRAIRS